MMKLLITGANGFIGVHLCRFLAAEGHELGIVSSLNSDLTLVESLAKAGVCRNSSISALTKFFQTRSFDGIIHLAACFVAEHQLHDVDRLIDANVIFGVHILEAATRSGIPWVLGLGTTWQNFNGESHNPVNLYAATKQAFEDAMRFYASVGQLRCATMKLTDTYGPGDTRPKLLSRWKSLSKTGEVLAMSAGEQVIDLLHVDDVVQAIFKLITVLERSDIDFQDFVISSQREITLRELAILVERCAGVYLNIQWGARPYRAREVMRPTFIGQPIPGWIPQISLEKGIQSYFNLCEEG